MKKAQTYTEYLERYFSPESLVSAGNNYDLEDQLRVYAWHRGLRFDCYSRYFRLRPQIDGVVVNNTCDGDHVMSRGRKFEVPDTWWDDSVPEEYRVQAEFVPHGNEYWSIALGRVTVVVEVDRGVVGYWTAAPDALHALEGDQNVAEYVEALLKSVWPHGLPEVVEDPRPQVNLLERDHNGNLRLKPHRLSRYAPYEARHYSEPIRDQLSAVRSWADSSDPGLTLLRGQPRTGKTFFLRAVLSECKNVEVALLSGRNVSDIDGPAMLQLLLNRDAKDRKPLLVLLEDGDEFVRKRSSGRDASPVAQLLNLTDGILGDMLNVKFMVTSNLKAIDVDPAILGAGRMKHRVEVGPLSAVEATAVAKSLGSNHMYTEPTPLGQVYADAPKAEVKQLDVLDHHVVSPFPGPKSSEPAIPASA